VESLAEVRIYFPDPWPKKRQQKRRLIQTEFVHLLASRVVRGGCLHLATDWADYAEHMLHVLDQAPDWRNRAGPGQSVPRPDWRIETHFEKRGLRLGHGVWDFIYERI
jgi:tRNA (guanine-N7-)-methyltransferase